MKISSLRSLVMVALLLLGACSGGSTTFNPTPVVSVCGNGVVENGEACDQGSANGRAGKCKADCSGIDDSVSVEGDIFAFLTEVSGPRLTGVKVSVLEHPEISVQAGDDAHFRIDNLKIGDDVTFVVEQPTIQTTQTATYQLGTRGILPVTIQVIPTGLFTGLALLLPLPPELDKYCAIATTVARMGGSLYAYQRQGMPDVSVSIDPPIDPTSGPIYFDQSARPNTAQVNTSIDGGVLFYRVPPGNYVLRASKAGAVFNTERITCRAGLFVNGGPPMGLLANVPNPDYAAGLGRTDDSYSASTDALCDETASCVNAANTPTSYPPSTQTSCKALYRNSWAYVDSSCDAIAKVRDAAKTFYTCRSATCANVLGDDTFCTAEDAAFRSAEASYGACVSGGR